jgi:hypothetical protein
MIYICRNSGNLYTPEYRLSTHSLYCFSEYPLQQNSHNLLRVRDSDIYSKLIPITHLKNQTLLTQIFYLQKLSQRLT